MQDVAHYDRGLWQTHGGSVSHCLAHVAPALFILTGLAGFVLSFALHSEWHIATKMEFGFGICFLFVLMGLFFNWVGPYLCTETGRLTYDRVRIVSHSLPSRSPKACGLMVQQFADAALLPLVLFSHRDLIPGSILQELSSYLLLQSPTGTRGPTIDGHVFPSSYDWPFVPIFWTLVIVCLVTSGVGVCCVAPSFAYASMQTTPWKAILAYTLHAAFVIHLVHYFVAVIPCDLSGHAMALAGDVECGSHLHLSYTGISCTLLVVFGLTMYSVARQFATLDESVNVMHIHPYRADPLGLGTSLLLRAGILITCGLELPGKFVLLFVMLIALIHAINSTMFRFSTVKMINNLARFTSYQVAWAGVTCAVMNIWRTMLEGETAGNDTVAGGGSGSTPASSAYHRSASKSTAVSVLSVVWLIGYLGGFAFFFGYQHKHYKGQWFHGVDDAEPGFEDLSAEVYL